MHRRFLSLLVPVALLVSLLGVVSTQAAPANAPSAGVAAWVAKAQLKGRANPKTPVVISVYLKLRDEAGLRDFIKKLYTKGTPEYHRFLTPDQFRAAYAPQEADWQAVKQFLTAQGFKVSDNAPTNRAYVEALGTIAQIERTFNVTENIYTFRGQDLRSNAQDPTLPPDLASRVTYIEGLDESDALIKPDILRDGPNAPPGPGVPQPGPCSTYYGDTGATVTPPAYQYGSTLAWLPCGYTPQQIRAAYGIDATGLTGAGVSVGVVDAFASPTIVQDVNMFSQHYGLPLLDDSNFVQLVPPALYNFPEGKLFDPQGWYGEQTLDIEWVHSIAPQAKIVYAGATTNLNHSLRKTLNNLINSGMVNIITNSYSGIGEEGITSLSVAADEQGFMQAAAMGISVLFSSGDDGDVAAQTGTAQGSYPATDPNVTAVGGTSVAIVDSAGHKMQWGWGTYRSNLDGSTTSQDGTVVTGNTWDPWPPEFFYGSGGGPSLHFVQPSYQAAVVPASIATTTVMTDGTVITFDSPHRVSPDISMLGDPTTGALVGQTLAISGDPTIDNKCTKLSDTTEYCEQRYGGTSLSSPLFAGVLALVNQSRFGAELGPIGFVNPVLYTLRSSLLQTAAVVDVLPPLAPTGLLRNVSTNGQITTNIRTINSTTTSTTSGVIEGADSSLRTTRYWDDVTGLGSPYAPAFVSALSSQ